MGGDVRPFTSPVKRARLHCTALPAADRRPCLPASSAGPTRRQASAIGARFPRTTSRLYTARASDAGSLTLADPTESSRGSLRELSTTRAMQSSTSTRRKTTPTSIRPAPSETEPADRPPIRTALPQDHSIRKSHAKEGRRRSDAAHRLAIRGSVRLRRTRRRCADNRGSASAGAPGRIRSSLSDRNFDVRTHRLCREF